MYRVRRRRGYITLLLNEGEVFGLSYLEDNETNREKINKYIEQQAAPTTRKDKTMNEKQLQELFDELPTFADSYKLVAALIEKLPGSMKYKGVNALKALVLAAVLITCKTANEEEKAIDELNNLLR